VSNFKTIFFLALLLSVFSTDVDAQNKLDNNLIQFSGIVITGDSLKPVPFVNIRIAGSSSGAVSDFNGFFSFVAHKGDTIVFSSVGYRSSRFYISDTLESQRYSLFQMLQTDTFLLTESVIYPWATVEALEYAIIQHRVAENDYDRAMRNLAIEEMKERAEALPMDGSMNYRHQMQMTADKAYWNGQYMPNNWLNPFAWAQFFKAWKEGKFKKKEKELDNR
jgi:hypothetical protein